MPSINLSYVNVAMDVFGLIVMLIIFAACLGEWFRRKTGSIHFLCLLGFVIVALAADTVSWICEGNPELRTITVISNTLAFCSGQIAIICFMAYLCQRLYETSKAAECTLNIFRVLCVLSLAYSIGNAFFAYSFAVSETGHWEHSENVAMVYLHFGFSILAFVAMILMALFATRSAKSSRVAFVSYTLFPIAGIIVDYSFHGISLTYVSIVISVLVIYTNIYLNRQRLIDAQRNALMISQINPHFTYNTLSTIAAMCDTSPKLAKSLTIDFSRYLRQNLETLTSETPIPFEKELEHVECYLKIEKARFRENLNVIYSIQCTDFSIPPLTVQPIVENAVKHGITKKAGGGMIKISTYSTETSYIIKVIDDGVGFAGEVLSGYHGVHVGIENVEARLQRMCHGSLSVKSTPDVGTRVTIVIPRKKG